MILFIIIGESMDFMFQRNFGFLYGTKGKALYIIFVAFLSFGLTEPATLCFATGSMFALLGIFQIGMYLKYPEYFEDQSSLVNQLSKFTLNLCFIYKPSESSSIIIISKWSILYQSFCLKFQYLSYLTRVKYIYIVYMYYKL